MKYLSVCSGVEAASVAWHPLGWEPVAFSEIVKFPSAVLAHHFPHVPNLGDMTKFKEWSLEPGSIGLLVGGTPCQSFSVAGLRRGLADPRGNLMLVYLAIAERFRPRWLVWENVPGVLSSGGGRDFGSFLGSLGDLGYGWAYRVLDAQWFGVAQRRRRVFVVGCIGDTAGAAKVLFERESLHRDTAPSRGKRETVTPSAEGCAGIGSHWDGPGHPHPTLSQVGGSGGIGASNQEVFGQRGSGLVDGAICLSSGQANSEVTHDYCPTLNCLHEAPIVFQSNMSEPSCGRDTSPALKTGNPLAVAYHPVPMVNMQGSKGTATAQEDGASYTLGSCGHDMHAILPPPVYAFEPGISRREGGDSRFTREFSPTLRATATDNRPAVGGPVVGVRRLTPKECERLQGFPDDWTRIPWRGKPAEQCPDGPRYKAIGNSMAVPVMRWIGERIEVMESQQKEGKTHEAKITP